MWKRRRLTTTIVLGTLVAAGVATLAVRLWMSRQVESQVAPTEIVEFEKLRPSVQKNRYVMCPVALCGEAANLPSPVFSMRWERLRDYWNEAIRLQPRVELVASSNGGRKLTYVQRSFLFRFPDIVTVEFIDLGGGRATLALASHSRYGKSDLGVNKERVENWVDLLVSMMRKEQISSSQ